MAYRKFEIYLYRAMFVFFIPFSLVVFAMYYLTLMQMQYQEKLIGIYSMLSFVALGGVVLMFLRITWLMRSRHHFEYMLNRVSLFA